MIHHFFVGGLTSTIQNLQKQMVLQQGRTLSGLSLRMDSSTSLAHLGSCVERFRELENHVLKRLSIR